VVVTRGDGVNKRLVAYVAPKAEYATQVLGSGAFAAHIKRELRHDLPGYMIPDDIVALEAIPLTVNGKVNRAALPPVADGCVRGERIAPRNETERRLVEIWKEVLLVDEIGVNEDFFELGGQSLLAMRLIGRMRREFRLEKAELPFGALFESPTIETFAEFIATAREHERMREQERYLISLQGNVEEGVF
jgi:aryl carrier-like protein